MKLQEVKERKLKWTSLLQKKEVHFQQVLRIYLPIIMDTLSYSIDFRCRHPYFLAWTCVYFNVIFSFLLTIYMTTVLALNMNLLFLIRIYSKMNKPCYINMYTDILILRKAEYWMKEQRKIDQSTSELKQRSKWKSVYLPEFIFVQTFNSSF